MARRELPLAIARPIAGDGGTLADMERTVAGVLEHLFTSVNPETGSRPPPHIAWVVFANGTAFFTAPTDELPLDAPREDLVTAACRALEELGPVVAGTPSGDFSPSLLDTWFPGEFVYFVTYDHPSIATIVFADEEAELAAGLEGRARRTADHEARRIELVRDFAGRVHRPD